jgi:hypothetical protein
MITSSRIRGVGYDRDDKSIKHIIGKGKENI